MKLDSRIKEGKKPLDCFDVDIARQFIGKKGYFGTHTPQFMNLDTYPKCIVDELKEIDNYDNYPFISAGGCCYCYFLPVEWVKEPENKWRAFKDHAEYKEFLNDGVIESWVKIKNKTTNEIYELMYVGGGSDEICLGGMVFSVSNLFDNFELFNECTREWLPFGVEGDEE